MEPWAADFDDPASVKSALTGARRVFLLTGGPDGPRHDRVAEAAAELGVEYLVKLSVLGISEGAATRLPAGIVREKTPCAARACRAGSSAPGRS